MAKGNERIRTLAVLELQSLLAAEPQLARAFKKLAAKAKHSRLRTFCREGVSYTKRRVKRVKQALKALDAPLTKRPSSGLPGLVSDALAAARTHRPPEQRDCAILAAVERISHYGLGIYTTIDRYLRAIGATEARKAIVPSTKEKRDAI